MPDAFLLSGRPTLARLSIAEVRVATMPDTSAEPREASLLRLTNVRIHLDQEVSVLDALDARLNLRPVPPPPASLQDLVRSGRRRLAEARQQESRDWLRQRVEAVSNLRDVLER